MENSLIHDWQTRLCFAEAAVTNVLLGHYPVHIVALGMAFFRCLRISYTQQLKGKDWAKVHQSGDISKLHAFGIRRSFPLSMVSAQFGYLTPEVRPTVACADPNHSSRYEFPAVLCALVSAGHSDAGLIFLKRWAFLSSDPISGTESVLPSAIRQAGQQTPRDRINSNAIIIQFLLDEMVSRGNVHGTTLQQAWVAILENDLVDLAQHFVQQDYAIGFFKGDEGTGLPGPAWTPFSSGWESSILHEAVRHNSIQCLVRVLLQEPRIFELLKHEDEKGQVPEALAKALGRKECYQLMLGMA